MSKQFDAHRQNPVEHRLALGVMPLSITVTALVTGWICRTRLNAAGGSITTADSSIGPPPVTIGQMT
jgi:hypothetical protein